MNEVKKMLCISNQQRCNDKDLYLACWDRAMSTTSISWIWPTQNSTFFCDDGDCRLQPLLSWLVLSIDLPFRLPVAFRYLEASWTLCLHLYRLDSFRTKCYVFCFQSSLVERLSLSGAWPSTFVSWNLFAQRLVESLAKRLMTTMLSLASEKRVRVTFFLILALSSRMLSEGNCTKLTIAYNILSVGTRNQKHRTNPTTTSTATCRLVNFMPFRFAINGVTIVFPV